MIPRETLDVIRCGVCAIGYVTRPIEDFAKDPQTPGYRIWGTGFLIRDDVVLTNRHVLLGLVEETQKRNIPHSSVFLQFNYPTPGGHRTSFLRPSRWGVVDVGGPDLATIEFERKSGPEFSVCKALPVADAYRIQVGQVVAAYGYPFGSTALEEDRPDGTRRVYRFGPVLQHGFVSAIAPFDSASHIERLLLDMRTSKGMSGSPVFEPYDGKVIGIHETGLEAVTAFAIPLTTARLTPILDVHDRAGLDKKLEFFTPKIQRSQPH